MSQCGTVLGTWLSTSPQVVNLRFAVNGAEPMKPILLFSGFFSDVFSAFYGQRLITAAWATRSPWSILFLFLSPSFTFHPLRGISCVQKFGISRRYMQPKKIGNINFFMKKN